MVKAKCLILLVLISVSCFANERGNKKKPSPVKAVDTLKEIPLTSIVFNRVDSISNFCQIDFSASGEVEGLERTIKLTLKMMNRQVYMIYELSDKTRPKLKEQSFIIRYLDEMNLYLKSHPINSTFSFLALDRLQNTLINDLLEEFNEKGRPRFFPAPWFSFWKLDKLLGLNKELDKGDQDLAFTKFHQNFKKALLKVTTIAPPYCQEGAKSSKRSNREYN